MSARNRELLALLPVAILVTAGFAAVFIVRSNEVSDGSLTYVDAQGKKARYVPAAGKGAP